MSPRFALYVHDQVNDGSAGDIIVSARELCERRGWKLHETIQDPAMLILALAAGRFNVLVVPTFRDFAYAIFAAAGSANRFDAPAAWSERAVEVLEAMHRNQIGLYLVDEGYEHMAASLRDLISAFLPSLR